ncbi:MULTISPECIES: fumarylacetoacetate hydrolase family protein [Mycobacterium]|uniref:fumarylacetoacetate hydrolase family protein n=1 Tax=Mycobacterium TaxID=1763 RepID=UPI0009F9F469
MVTPAELNASRQPEVDTLLRVTGEQRQHDNTGAMAWPTPELISYVNEGIELRCGDLLFSGTTAVIALRQSIPATSRCRRDGNRAYRDIPQYRWEHLKPPILPAQVGQVTPSMWVCSHRDAPVPDSEAA